MESKYIILPIEGEQFPKKTAISKTQLKGIYKLASVILPRTGNFPKFEETKPENHVGGMIDYMYPDDKAAILLLLSIFAYTPRFIIKGIMHLVETGAHWPSVFGVVFRLLRIALKGLIFTLYYSDFTPEKSIHRRINWDAKMVID